MKKTFILSQAALLIFFLFLLSGNSASVLNFAHLPATGNDTLSGSIQGVITDSTTKEGLSFATVVLTQNGAQVMGANADLDGNYILKPLKPGKYSLTVSSLGYKPVTINDITVIPGGTTTLNIAASASSMVLKESIVTMACNRSAPNSIVYKLSGKKNKAYSPNFKAEDTRYKNESLVKKERKDSNSGDTTRNVYNPYPDEEYAPLIENEYIAVKDEALSTFSIDVDDAAYTNFRRYVNKGMLPPKDAIRIEEFINFFSYNYAQPTDGHPFAISMEQATCPWNPDHQLVGIGIKGRNISLTNVPPCNLVFLIDVSGSMSDPDKLPLVKNCFKLLVKQLRQEDKVSIVVYAGSSGLVLPPTSGMMKDKINKAIDNLEAGGSTAGGAGIELAYKTAKENFIQSGNNRVILATDGDFNVGVSSESDLLHLIESKRDDGIFLTTLGFGGGNYKDNTMELLADKGNGNYSYIDNFQQGKKVFVEQLTSTLLTIAKDVKFQIEFNPAQVKGYRLIGYENRLLNKEDFNNDKKDAGDIGAGHTVTAFYEIIPAGSSEKISDVDELKYQVVKANTSAAPDDLLTLKMRYKKPEEHTSVLMTRTLKKTSQGMDICSEDFRFAAAVAEFSIVLRESKFKGNASFKQAIDLAKANKGTDADGSRAEFIKLAATAADLVDTRTASSK